MKHRFHVVRDGRRIASVVAESAAEAIATACQKTGSEPEHCIAVEITADRAVEE